MLSTWSKRPAKEEIYGSLTAKEVPSDKTIRDIWIVSLSGAQTIGRTDRSRLVSDSSGPKVTLTSWKFIARRRKSRLARPLPERKRSKSHP